MFKHPKQVCMTYFSHMKFSFYLGKEFAKASICAFIHGFFPDLLVTHSTDTLIKLKKDMSQIGCKKIIN